MTITLSHLGIMVRGCLLITGAIVLGISITLAKHQAVGRVPPETGFSAFAGAIGIVASIVGMVALWCERLEGGILRFVDTFVALSYLAGAISLNVALRGIRHCNATDMESKDARYTNSILNGGCVDVDKGTLCYAVSADGKRDLTPDRCVSATADYIFQYAGFVIAIVMVLLG
ncbi:hypothetical protein F4808DRAFT_238337 [Astrocystis sublimbata]|nr:hypothetical protein F4808DRAFT_238337 [Astrocystis sublimbata]